MSDVSEQLLQLVDRKQVSGASVQGGPVLVSMYSARHVKQELLDPSAAAKEVAFASLVPREDGKRNETFTRGIGKVIDSGSSLDGFVAAEVDAVHASDTGAMNCGEGVDERISLRPQDPAEKLRVHRELRDGKSEQGVLNNEYRLSRWHLQKEGHRWMIKEHPDARVEQLSLWCIGRILQAQHASLDEPIVVLPWKGKSATLPFALAQRHFVEATGVPMEKILDAVKDLAKSAQGYEAMELNYLCDEAERLGELTRRFVEAGAGDAARP